EVAAADAHRRAPARRSGVGGDGANAGRRVGVRCLLPEGGHLHHPVAGGAQGSGSVVAAGGGDRRAGAEIAGIDGVGAHDQVVGVAGGGRTAVGGVATARRRRGPIQRSGGIHVVVFQDADVGITRRRVEGDGYGVAAAGNVLGVIDSLGHGGAAGGSHGQGIAVAGAVGDRGDGRG